MKPINVCITVFNRYDLLKNLVGSLRRSEVRPTGIYIIDRGHDVVQLRAAIGDPGGVVLVDLEGQSLAAAWNWFIRNVPEERILASDDVEFSPETIGAFVGTPGDFVGTKDTGSSHFACFLIRDSCVKKVGLFDEAISPDYLYFEDCDYGHRMKLAGVPLLGVHLRHLNSQSLMRKTPEQVEEHHRRFCIARDNYLSKWGSPPSPGGW